MATEKITYELSLRDLMTKGLGDINNKMSLMENKLNGVNKASKKTSGGMNSMFNTLKGGLAAVAAIGVFDFAKEMVQTSAKMQGMSNAISVSSKNSEDAAKNLGFLNDLTQKMPISLDAAYEGFKTFSGGLIGTSLQGDKGRQIFEQISTGAASMGLTAEQTKGAFLALGQMMSKGTVQAEELRGQLGERIPGAFGMMAEALGVTTGELGKMMQAGKVLAVDAIPKFAAIMEGRFKKGLDTANNSINASIVRLENLKTLMSIGMTDGFGKFMKIMADFAISVYNNFEPLKEALVFLWDIGMDLLNSLIEPISTLINLFGFGGDKINWMSVSLKMLATGIMVAIYPIRILIDAFTTVLDVITLIIQSLGNMAKAIKYALKGDFTTVKAIGTVQKVLMGSFVEETDKRFGKPFQEIKDIWTDSKKTNNATSGGGADSTTLLGGGGNNDKLKSELNGISGKAPTNFNINIENLLKIDTMQPKNNDGSLDSTQNNFLEQLQNALLTIVNDVNYIQPVNR